MSERASTAVVLCALSLMACGEEATARDVAPIAAPERTAAQDEAVRALLMDVAEGRACEALRDRFLPLPEDRAGRPREGRPVVEGRLWVSECGVERRGGRLAVHLGGRGWQWVERSGAGPLGSRFTVRGTQRFEATVDLEAELDLRYDERDRRASVMLTAAEPPRARVTPIGAIPVEPDGGWSGIVGGLGGLLGSSPEARAREMLEEEAAALLRRELARGATFTLDLCTSQLDVTVGALGDGAAPPAHPYEDDGRLWLANERVRLHPDALDLSGPWPTEGAPLLVDLDVERGDPLTVAVLCRSEAAMAASSYLAGGDAAARSVVARREVRRGGPATIRVAPDACETPHVLVSPEGRGEAPTTYRLRVRREGDDAAALARCGR